MTVLEQLKLDEPYKAVLYISVILFMLSFFTNPNNIDLDKFRYGSLTFVISSLILWCFHQYFEWDMDAKIGELKEEGYEIREIKQKLHPKVIKWYSLVGIVYLISLLVLILI